MAVVARVVLFAVRALLALIPGLAVSTPIKKWAAAAALVAAAFYLLLSGAEDRSGCKHCVLPHPEWKSCRPRVDRRSAELAPCVRPAIAVSRLPLSHRAFPGVPGSR